MELWQAGDLEEDLKNLEMALTYLNADQNRYHDERLEALDYFAQSRHPLALHIRRFILEPLIWSLLLSFSMQRLRLVRPFRIVSLVQFWTASVMAPCILLCLIVRTKSKSQVATSCPDASETEYYQNLSYITKSSKFWSAPEDVRSPNSTSDYVQCLLEQWVFCILGGIAAGVSWLVITLVQPVRFRTNVVLFVQMITRCGIMASLQQYPPLWFALNRKKQPRPLNWPVWATQQLIRNQWFKLCATVDVALLALSYPSIYRCYVPAIALTTILWCFAVQSERWINDPKGNADASLRTARRGILENRMHQLARIVQPLSVSACLLWMWYFSQSIVDFAQRVLESLTTTRFPSFIGMFGYKLAAGACLLIALVGPICHIAAVSKLFQASFMHNASLSMDLDLFRKSVSAWRWRYCLKWREPKRIGVVLEQWWNRFWYWLFLKGSVDEKLQQESEKLLRGGTSVQSRGLSVWQRVATEPSTYSGMDRTQWKTKAMERIARKHQYDYDRGSFDDPLGVAVYRTLGIGLGFETDHMRKLNETEVPSIRRLQSRAAKSSIKRVNELYRNATTIKSALDQIADPVERQKQATILQQDIDAEIQSLADRLANLVPNDPSSEEPDVPIEQFVLGTPKRIAGTNQYTYIIPSLQSHSPALQRLFADYFANQSTSSYEIDYLNPMGTNETSLDDEFIAAWYQRNPGKPLARDDKQDDQESYEETFFV